MLCVILLIFADTFVDLDENANNNNKRKGKKPGRRTVTPAKKPSTPAGSGRRGRPAGTSPSQDESRSGSSIGVHMSQLYLIFINLSVFFTSGWVLS